MRKEEMWRFETAQFAVVAYIAPDDEADLSWADAETIDAINTGEFAVFGMIVEVEKNGHVIGRDSLWNCVERNPSQCFSEHWKAEKSFRNTLELKANNMAVCHYFPSMVAQAIADARSTLE